MMYIEWKDYFVRYLRLLPIVLLVWFLAWRVTGHEECGAGAGLFVWCFGVWVWIFWPLRRIVQQAARKKRNPAQVMTSLRKMAELLEEPIENNPALADLFSQTIQTIRTGRGRDFSRQQLWELTQMESHLEQKLARSERKKGGQP